MPRIARMLILFTVLALMHFSVGSFIFLSWSIDFPRDALILNLLSKNSQTSLQRSFTDFRLRQGFSTSPSCR